MKSDSHVWKAPQELVLHKSKHWVVNYKFECNYPGYVIISPKTHNATDLLDLSNAELKEMGLVLKVVSKTIKQIFKPERIYLCKFGNTANCSFHFHVIPIHKWAIRAFLMAYPKRKPVGPEITEYISNQLIHNSLISKPIEYYIAKLRAKFRSAQLIKIRMSDQGHR
jgi:diadenosine tetraphosphate (Ap4A) HIT family hydrolase